jgi:hypothetical protein
VNRNDSRFLRGWEMQKWLFVLALACTAPLSIKWTGIATPALLAVELTFGLFFVNTPLPLWALLEVAFIVVVTYTYQWWIHFLLLPLSGDGDAFHLVRVCGSSCCCSLPHQCVVLCMCVAPAFLPYSLAL